MGEVKKFNYFGAIPGRATRDTNLTALHFRVLMVVAGRERMSRNGQLCWENPIKLAARISCHPKRFSAAVSDLISMGYIEAVKSESDKRKRGLRVRYEAAEDAPGIGVDLDKIKLRDGNQHEESRLRDGNQYRQSRLRDGNQSATTKHAANPSDTTVPGVEAENAIYSVKLKTYKPEGCREKENQRRRYGAATHSELAKKVGGWDVLQALSGETLAWLERRCSDGTIEVEDILAAKREALERGAA